MESFPQRVVRTAIRRFDSTASARSVPSAMKPCVAGVGVSHNSSTSPENSAQACCAGYRFLGRNWKRIAALRNVTSRSSSWSAS
jgi:hypothetical protein